MVSKKKLLIGVMLLCVVGAGGYAAYRFRAPSENNSSGLAPTTASPAPVALSPEEQKTMSETMAKVVEVPAPALGPMYTNKKYGFSVQMPNDFKVQELPGDDATSQTVLLQNTKGDGVQILITKYPDTAMLTGDDVRSNIPDMRVVQEQVVNIGPDYRGVAFMSDNDAFAGASREVWFVFHGNLYQISTYARLDPLLKSMFITWKFF